MRISSRIVAVGAGIAALGVLGAYAFAQHGPGMGHGRMGMGHGMGPGMMQGMGPGMGRMGMGHGMMSGSSATPAEHGEIHDLFANNERIKRTVTNLPDGIRTVTESDDPELAKVIISHVVGMGKRVEEGRDPRIPIQSPTLQVLFKNRDKIKSTYESTPKGITVVQTSADAETVAALQKHAAEVSVLVARGMDAAHEAMMGNAGGMMQHRNMHRGSGPRGDSAPN